MNPAHLNQIASPHPIEPTPDNRDTVSKMTNSIQRAMRKIIANRTVDDASWIEGIADSLCHDRPPQGLVRTPGLSPFTQRIKQTSVKSLVSACLNAPQYEQLLVAWLKEPDSTSQHAHILQSLVGCAKEGKEQALTALQAIALANQPQAHPQAVFEHLKALALEPINEVGHIWKPVLVTLLTMALIQDNPIAAQFAYNSITAIAINPTNPEASQSAINTLTGIAIEMNPQASPLAFGKLTEVAINLTNPEASRSAINNLTTIAIEMNPQASVLSVGSLKLIVSNPTNPDASHLAVKGLDDIASNNRNQFASRIATL